MSLETANTLALDPTFRGKVKVAVAKAAKAVIGEDITEGYEVRHEKRHITMTDTINHLQNRLDNWVYGTVANPAITSGSDDGAIEFTVNSLVDDMSGVTITETPPPAP